jgi:hypothetical protein
VILPGDDPSLGVEAALEAVPARRAVEAVPHVVFTGPDQLDGRPGLAGDPGRLDHVLIGQPAPETAPGPDNVDGDVFGLQAQGLGDKLATGLRILGRRPDLHLSVQEPGGAVLGLQVRMGDVGVGVFGLDRL